MIQFIEDYKEKRDLINLGKAMDKGDWNTVVGLLRGDNYKNELWRVFIKRVNQSDFSEDTKNNLFILLDTSYDLFKSQSNDFQELSGYYGKSEYSIPMIEYILLNNLDLEITTSYFVRHNYNIESYYELLVKTNTLDKYIHHIKDYNLTTDASLDIIKLYYSYLFSNTDKPIDIEEYTLENKRTIYVDLCGKPEYLSELVRKRDVIDMLKSGMTLTYTPLLGETYQPEYINLFLNNMSGWKWGCKKLMENIESIDATNTETYNHIMSVLRCKPSELLVIVLDKTGLSVKEKRELLLLSAKKSCNLN